VGRRKGNNKEDSGPFKLWPVAKVILLLVAGYALGWNFGYVSGKEDGSPITVAPSATSSETSTDTSNADNYGRNPGHPHYGHTHP
jgi:hypothetical protein